MRDTGYHFSKQLKQKFSQGGEKKVMKKSLSAILAAALVFGSFGSLAYAADAPTAQEKFDALKAKGIFAGVNADGDAGLDQEMTRAQFARVAALLLELEGIGNPDTKSVTVKPFPDVALGAWYTEEIAAIKEAKIMAGNANGKFNAGGKITVQETAVVLANVLGLAPVADATVEGASPWAAGYIKAVEAAGVVLPTAYKANATRELLVSAAFAADVVINAPAAATSITVTATAAKKLSVTFNAAVDTAKAKVTVWNGTNQVNSKSVTFAEDKKSAVIEFAMNLPAAEYTVKVEGISEKALTAAVKVEAEKVAKIEIKSDKAALNRGDSTVISLPYKVLNQYNEEINSTALSATAGKGVATAASGKLTLDADNAFVLGEKVVVSLVHTSGAFATATVEVSSVAQVASVDIVKLYNADGKELVAGSNDSFKLLIDLKDQYGASVTDTTYLTNGADVIVTVSNTSAATFDGFETSTNKANFTKVTVDGKDYVSLLLTGGAALKAGTSNVTIISKSNGAKDSFDVVVKDNVQVDTLTLTAPASAPAGATVEIPFTAVDQFGAAIANPSNGQVNSISVTNGTYQGFVKDVVKNTTSFKVTLGAKGTTIVTVITKTNKVAQLSINVTDAKTPTVISGTKDIDTSFLVGGTATLATGNVVVKDQYGNDITLPGNYTVKVETSDASKVSKDAAVTAPVVLTAAAKGTSSITLTLLKDGVAVDNSSYTYTTKVVEKADIKSYAATVAGTVYTLGGADYNKALTVKGTLEDGSTVTVPALASNYEVSTGGTAGFSYTSGKFAATNAFVFSGTDTSADAVAVVTIFGASAQENVPVTVKVSKAAAAVATLELVTNGIATKEADGVVSVTAANINGGIDALLDDVIKAVDQYGVEWKDANEPDYTPYVGNYPSGKSTLASLVAGDTITVTALVGTKSIAFKVIVK